MFQIRPLAICTFRKEDRIRVAGEYDPVKDETFYRALGGGIEFGERAEETIAREPSAEIGADIAPGSLKYLGAVENIFTFNGIAGHEIVMIYSGELPDAILYEQAVIQSREANGEAFIAMWKHVNHFLVGGSILYQTGCLESWRSNLNGPAGLSSEGSSGPGVSGINALPMEDDLCAGMS